MEYKPDMDVHTINYSMQLGVSWLASQPLLQFPRGSGYKLALINSLLLLLCLRYYLIKRNTSYFVLKRYSLPLEGMLN